MAPSQSRLIGWLPHTTNPISAGVRIRCLTPLRKLRACGVPVELFEPANVDLYRAILIQGLCCLPSKERPDWSGDALLDRVRELKQRGCLIFVEDCDNHFYNPRALPEWSALSERLRVLLTMADRFVASTDVIANVFRPELPPGTPISIVGDGVETKAELDPDPFFRRVLSWRRRVADFELGRFKAHLRSVKRRGGTRLVWFGSHGSSYADGGMQDLQRISNLLESLAKKHLISLSVISNNRDRFEKLIAPLRLSTQYLAWDRTTFLRALSAHDIAVLPITQSAFTDCKSANRLTLALSVGLACCADGIPSYQPFSDCASLDDWEAGLSRYIENPELRRQHAQIAQERIARDYSVAAVIPQWRAVFESNNTPHS